MGKIREPAQKGTVHREHLLGAGKGGRALPEAEQHPS